LTEERRSDKTQRNVHERSGELTDVKAYPAQREEHQGTWLLTRVNTLHRHMQLYQGTQHTTTLSHRHTTAITFLPAHFLGLQSMFATTMYKLETSLF